MPLRLNALPIRDYPPHGDKAGSVGSCGLGLTSDWPTSRTCSAANSSMTSEIYPALFKASVRPWFLPALDWAPGPDCAGPATLRRPSVGAVYLGYAVIARDFVLSLAQYRGVNNSPWVGLEMALATALLVSLVGFYVVENAVDRDPQTSWTTYWAKLSVTSQRWASQSAS